MTPSKVTIPFFNGLLRVSCGFATPIQESVAPVNQKAGHDFIRVSRRLLGVRHVNSFVTSSTGLFCDFITAVREPAALMVSIYNLASEVVQVAQIAKNEQVEQLDFSHEK